jgi:hypothetical protein
MKPLSATLGLVTACAACCAVPLVLPLLFGAAGAGAGLIALESPVFALLVGAGFAVTALTVCIVKRARKSACALPEREPS